MGGTEEVGLVVQSLTRQSSYWCARYSIGGERISSELIGFCHWFRKHAISRATSTDGITGERFPVKVGRWQFETSLLVLSLSTALSY